MKQSFNFITEVGTILNTVNPTTNYNVGKNNQKTNTPCPDIYAGKIVNGNVTVNTTWFDGNSRYLYNKNQNPIRSLTSNPNNYMTIVIIIESPHGDEYNKYPNFINPALGVTGDNLKTYYEDFMNAVASFYNQIFQNSYRIILMNSIQYQCSMGLPLNGSVNRENKEVRDMIFSTLWSDQNDTYGMQNDFIERLKSYAPDIIINLCTVGLKLKKYGGNLRDDLVQRIIKNNFSSKTLIVGYHPSGWRRGRNRYVWDINDCKKRKYFK